MAIEKIKILGAVLDCTANSAPLAHFRGKWAGLAVLFSPHRISIFSIAMGADYSFELNSIETYAPNFLDIINNLFLGSAWYSGSFYKGLLWK